MRAQKELELKLEIEPASLPLLKGIPFVHKLKEAPTHAREVSVYFDTDEHSLRKRGLSLRVRRIGKRYIQTIKAIGNSGSFERDEWETEIEDGRPDLRLATGTPLKTLMDKVGHRLKPLFETRVHRTVYPLSNEAFAIEFTIDRGRIDTGVRSVPICELELEIKRGSEMELFSIAREVTRRVPAQLAFKSKSERGYELIDGDDGSPVKATPIVLSADLSTRDAFTIIGRACLQQIVDNEPAIAKGHPEGVHQMRVGVRRLRAAMSLFSGLFTDSQTTAIKRELKWLIAALTQARELEVLMSRVVTPVKKMRDALWKDVPSLSQELAKKHKAAVARAHDVVTSARFRALSLDVAAWLETGHCIQPTDDLVRSRGALPIRMFAIEQLQRRWRKVRKRGKALAQLDAQSRHRLRIQVKKLRYAAEFFGSLFSDKEALKHQKEFVATLAHMQDGLGELNDIVVDENIIASTGFRNRRSNIKRAFATGLLTGREAAGLDAAMATATAGYAELVNVKPFWR